MRKQEWSENMKKETNENVVNVLYFLKKGINLVNAVNMFI